MNFSIPRILPFVWSRRYHYYLVCFLFLTILTANSGEIVVAALFTSLFVVCEWVIPEKIHTTTTEGMLENLTRGSINGSGNSDGRGDSELKNTSLGVTFDFIYVSIAPINKFSTNCFVFSNFIILSNYRPLTTLILFYVSIHRIAFVTFVEAKCEYINLARAKSEASISLLMIKAIKFKSNNMNSKSRKEIFTSLLIAL